MQKSYMHSKAARISITPGWKSLQPVGQTGMWKWFPLFALVQQSLLLSSPATKHRIYDDW